MTQRADSDGFRIDRSDVVVLFAHIQQNIIANSGTASPKMIEAGAIALAEAASLLDLPILHSLVLQDDGEADPVQGLRPFVDDASRFAHRCASPFMDERFVTALAATGRKTLVIAGYSTEAIILFTALDALAAGYRVIVALDACGARSSRTEDAVLRRIERAGATTSSVLAVVMGCAPEFDRSPGEEVLSVVRKFLAIRD